MSGQVAELKVAPSSNGDSAGSWEGKREFDKDHLGLTAKPKPVSLTLHPELHVSHFYYVIFPDHKSAKALPVETITWNQTTLCTPLPSLHPVAAPPPTPSLFSRVSCWHCPRAVLSTPYKKGGDWESGATGKLWVWLCFGVHRLWVQSLFHPLPRSWMNWRKN